MMGGAKAGYECIKAFSETDFTEDLKKIQSSKKVYREEEMKSLEAARVARASV